MENYLSKEEARRVIENGTFHGSGTHVKDCFWSGFEYKGKFFLSLNGNSDMVFETSKEEMLNHCNDE